MEGETMRDGTLGAQADGVAGCVEAPPLDAHTAAQPADDAADAGTSRAGRTTTELSLLTLWLELVGVKLRLADLGCILMRHECRSVEDGLALAHLEARLARLEAARRRGQP